MTYRFGRISKSWLRKTAFVDPKVDALVDAKGREPFADLDQDLRESKRRYAAVPGLPEAYGSLGYSSMAIGSMDRAIQAGHRIARFQRRHHGIPCYDPKKHAIVVPGTNKAPIMVKLLGQGIKRGIRIARILVPGEGDVLIPFCKEYQPRKRRRRRRRWRRARRRRRRP